MKLPNKRRPNRLFRKLLFITVFLHTLLLLQRFPSFFSPVPVVPKLVIKLLEDEQKTKKQIVQSEDPEDFEAVDDAFLSDKNRSFDRNRVARKVDSFKKAAKGGGAEGKKTEKDLNLSDLGATPTNADPLKSAAEAYTERKNGRKSGSEEAQEMMSSTNDHVPEVPLGDLTELNTAEYKYYGFYHRIRQKLEQFWGRSLQEKAEVMVQDGRRLPASEEYITSLRITLDRKGKIVSISVMTTSGVKELDDAAIESFNEAGPFPNPPKDLIVDGKVTLEWGFVVKS